MTLAESFRERCRERAELIRPFAWDTLAVLRHQNAMDRAVTEYWRAKCHAYELDPF